MPTPSIQFPASQAPVQTAVQAEAQPAAARQAAAAPVLGGPGVTVSVTGSSLDKLVEKIKGESENARLDAAKRRIAIVLTVLAALNIEVTDAQKKNLAQLAALQGMLDELSEILNGKNDKLSAADAATAALAAKTAELEAAVARAVKDGEAHRKQVEELKKTRSADDAELRAAQDALAKAEAAETLARTNLDKNRADLAAAQASCETVKKEIAELKSRIAGVEKQVSDCVSAVGDKALASIAAGLRAEAAAPAPESRESQADREKEEAKKIANDPLRAIRDALDRMDADIRRTIEDNRTLLV